MNDIVIKVESLWKQYRYGSISHATLRKDFQSWWARMRGKPDPNLPIDFNLSTVQPLGNSTDSDDRFWALRDVSFEVKQGEVLGIIGKNGAGKSTLLKIMSRVTTPTKGSIKIKGHVASLLEVGTGFHPELTGRENIFLNGAILGMTKAEIKKKFDEIVAFAEVEKFIDTPVKRYSSGMYVRLAFAVAAHLEPEILIVDEVLAVGDAQFQKKCLGKMGDIGKEGRTILFVSHNMQAIRTLCKRGIVLSQGTQIFDGPIADAVAHYSNIMVVKKELDATTAVGNETNRRGSGAVRFSRVKILNDSGVETQVFGLKDNVRFCLDYTVNKRVENLYVGMGFRSAGTGMFVTSTRDLVSPVPLEAGHCGSVTISFPHINLRPHEYLIYLWLGNNRGQAYDVVDDVLPPLVIETDKDMDELGYSPTDVPGFFDIDSTLTVGGPGNS